MRLRPKSVLLLAVLLVTASLTNKLDAQTTTSGGLTGVVTDPSHALVPDTRIEIKNDAKGNIQSTKTDREGVYRFSFLAPGRYTLTATHAGFREEKQAINILLGPPVSVNVTLQLAKVSAGVDVIAEAPLLQAENGDVSVTMSSKQISEAPNPGNDLTYIAQTAPGVVMNTDLQGSASFSILGMPGTSYLYTMDGMNNNDNSNNLSRAGTLNLLLGQNEVQEATVVSTGYSGQFGGAAGGNINYITKSGGNEFHGNAQYYWNGTAFNANDWFLKAIGKPRFFESANQWAGSIGGPIKKDKLFFFFDTEGLHLVIPNLSYVMIPSSRFEAATIANIDTELNSSGQLRFGPNSATDAFYRKMFSLYNAAPGASSAIAGVPGGGLGCAGFSDPASGLGIAVPCASSFLPTRDRPSQNTLTASRVDWNGSGSDRAFLRLQYSAGRNAIATDPISPLFDANYNQPSWQGQVIETHTFGASAASQFLMAGSYFAPIYQTRNPSQALSAFPAELYFNSNILSPLGGIDNFAAFGYGRYNAQFQVSEDVQKTWGNQKLGFGASFQRILWSELPNKVNAIGQLTVQTLDAFYQGGVDPASPQNDFTTLTQAFTSQTFIRLSFLNFALYGQDEWHARPNLTLTLALRAEHYPNPVCLNSCFARLPGAFDSLSHDPGQPYNQAILTNQKQAVLGADILWSPRFSFAWQPLGVSHNTVVRGGIGIFYDPSPGSLFDFSGNPPLLNSYTIVGDNLTPNETTNLFQDAKVSNAAFVNGFNTGQTLAKIQKADANFSPPAINVSARRMQSPQYQRWSLQLQQAFGAGTSVSLGYFGHHGIHELALNNSANAYCNPAVATLPNGGVNPCFGFASDLPLSVPDPRFSQVTEITSAAVSNYNGMVVSFQHRFTGWTQGMFQANYTYGHAFDEVSNGGYFSFNSGSSIYPQDPNNLRGAYGPAEYDVRHSLNANYVWELPVKQALGGHGPDSLVKGWQVSGTIFARSGFPYTVFDLEEAGILQQNNYFAGLYAVPVGPLGRQASCGEGAATPPGLYPCQPPQVLLDGTPNPKANFVQAGCETGFNTGTLPSQSGPCGGRAVSFAQGRNRFRGPNYFNTDLAIMKNTKVPGWENAVLGIGFQFFNLFNHTNFQTPDNGISDPTFGQIGNPEQPPTSILGGFFAGDVSARMIQLKAQLRF
jgi:Carboxypeptidase regulatory-like domain